MRAEHLPETRGGCPRRSGRRPCRRSRGGSGTGRPAPTRRRRRSGTAADSAAGAIVPGGTRRRCRAPRAASSRRRCRRPERTRPDRRRDGSARTTTPPLHRVGAEQPVRIGVPCPRRAARSSAGSAAAGARGCRPAHRAPAPAGRCASVSSTAPDALERNADPVRPVVELVAQLVDRLVEQVEVEHRARDASCPFGR